MVTIDLDLICTSKDGQFFWFNLMTMIIETLQHNIEYILNTYEDVYAR